ncbi:MAG: hypothetical protein VW338_03780 [Rhodospirillaceae bacterium]
MTERHALVVAGEIAAGLGLGRRNLFRRVGGIADLGDDHLDPALELHPP